MIYKWKKEGKTNYMPAIVYINNITDLNSQEQTVFIEVSIQLWFQDDRLIGKEDGEVPESDLWNPGIEVLGAIDVEEMVEDGKGSVRFFLVLPTFTHLTDVEESILCSIIFHLGGRKSESAHFIKNSRAPFAYRLI
jgi:hypothetical protein